MEEIRNEWTTTLRGEGAEGVQTKREKFLIFSLLDESYGVPLSSVKEVIGLAEITKIPNVPEYFCGLINLRGKIISVIDLRLKLMLPTAAYQEKKTCIIIVEIHNFILGVIVDDVSAVSGFMQDQIERHLDINSKVSREFITGVAKTGDRKLTLLLDISKALNVEELRLMRERVNGVAEQPQTAPQSTTKTATNITKAA